MGMKGGHLSVKGSVNLMGTISEVWSTSVGRGALGQGAIQREMGRRILIVEPIQQEAVQGGWWKLETRREYAKLKYWIGILWRREDSYNNSRIDYLTKKKSNWVKIIYQLVNNMDSR